VLPFTISSALPFYPIDLFHHGVASTPKAVIVIFVILSILDRIMTTAGTSIKKQQKSKANTE